MTGTGERPVLYTSAGSRGLRASWAASELGIDLEYRMLPFPPRFQAREYLDVNPLGTVPALLHDGHVLTESSAITHYLATRWGPTRLAVAPEERDYGAYLDFLHYGESTITFPQTVYLRFSVFEQNLGFSEAGEAYAKWYSKRLIKAERQLENREYLCADRFTCADIAVAYALRLSLRIGLDHLVPASLQDYRTRMIARAGFIDAVAAEEMAAEVQGVV